jgi:serine/threonine protein kinase
MGNYGNLKQIDAGGQAVIYLGYDFDGQRWVIFKYPKHDNDGTRRRLKREARLIKEQEDNPFVVKLIEDSSHCTPPFLVLEYCTGGSLADWILNRHSVTDVVKVMIQAMLALQPNHEKNGFHGDFTPRNIRLAEDPDGVRVRLIDFGLGQTPNHLSGTMTRDFRGTPNYIAPEVQKGDDYTWRSDIWSAHVVFRELLTGLKSKLLFDFSPPPRELTNLIDRMGAENPLTRPNTVEIVKELRAYLDKPVAVPKPIAIPQNAGTGLGLLVTTLLVGSAVVLANKNTYDSKAGRYRNRNGQFASGWFG